MNAEQDAAFSVTASGQAPLIYQWQKDGVNLTDGPTGTGSTVAGATTADLSISNVNTNDMGSYRVVVAGGGGSTTSPVAALTVNRLAQIISFEPIVCGGAGTMSFYSMSCVRLNQIANQTTLFTGEVVTARIVGGQVVARDAFSDYPEQATQVKDIGGGWGEFDSDAIIALNPDLVLAAEINPQEQVKALEDLGLNVFYLSNPKDLDGMYDNLHTVAKLTGHESEAEIPVESLNERVAAVDKQVAAVSDRPLVFCELDGTDPNAPWTSGPGTFIDLLLARAGGSNLAISWRAHRHRSAWRTWSPRIPISSCWATRCGAG